jgi:allophanate hydrolase
MLTIAGLLRDYRSGAKRPDAVIREIFRTIRAGALQPTWISLADETDAVARAKAIDVALPLAGVPFAVKDNIDVAGLPTTAGCPSFAFTPQRSASVVARLEEAGAILIGKTNLDQFATGLVGVRSPYGACSSVFNDRYISGGSSSGSAVAVAKGLCAFSLGTDTAGSGRVPAAFNNLVGLKPTRGVLSAAGVVPACRSLDCVSIFASTPADAGMAWQLARGVDDGDPFSRAWDDGRGAAPWAGGAFRFGMPRADDLEFFGDDGAEALFREAVDRLITSGGTPVAIDFGPFREAARLLYAGPWVAERFAAVGEFLSQPHPDVHPVVRDIILGGARPSAADAFRGAYRLHELMHAAAQEWARMDILLLPTTGTIYTHSEIEADPVRLNSNLGHYTNFVNLMDLAAIAVPAGFRANGLPFGVSLIGPAFSDAGLVALAERFATLDGADPLHAPGCVAVAVVGAHLTGQPLNGQLTDRGARLVLSCRTAPAYRLFALANTNPPKPGLVREAGYEGRGIEVEVWLVPADRFGGFVAAVPPPLAIGSVQLASGAWVKGFVCEPGALAGAREITSFGGWRNYLAQRPESVSPSLV